MGFDYDLEELDDSSSLYSDDAELDYGSDYETDSDEEACFEDIDFEALGIDPTKPTNAKPGSQEKVLMLAARYAAGVPLWHDHDCYDHGPGESMQRLLRPTFQSN